jgi:CBS domain-containing membrane protein
VTAAEQEDPFVSEEANLELDVHRPSRGAPPVARIRVGFARGYASDGSPTLTVDCRTLGELEREVERLGEEMAAAVRAAEAELGGKAKERAAEPSEVAPESAASTAHIESDLSVGDVMTRKVRTVGRNDALAVAEGLMRAGHFRHTVVLDEDGSLAGVLSQRDFVFSALSWHLGQGSKARDQAIEHVVAKELMQTQVVTIAPDAPLAEAARLMTEHKVGCLPVMEGPQLVGIITEGDFLALLGGR